MCTSRTHAWPSSDSMSARASRSRTRRTSRVQRGDLQLSRSQAAAENDGPACAEQRCGGPARGCRAGEAILADLTGFWAFTIYEKAAHADLVRDSSHQPLYYWLDGERLCVASMPARFWTS